MISGEIKLTRINRPGPAQWSGVVGDANFVVAERLTMSGVTDVARLRLWSASWGRVLPALLRRFIESYTRGLLRVSRETITGSSWQTALARESLSRYANGVQQLAMAARVQEPNNTTSARGYLAFAAKVIQVLSRPLDQIALRDKIKDTILLMVDDLNTWVALLDCIKCALDLLRSGK